jgi:hypothetical protein
MNWASRWSSFAAMIIERREADRLLQADIRDIPQQTAMQNFNSIHRLAETGAGRVITLKGQSGEMRLRVGDFRVRFTEESDESEGSSQSQKAEGTLYIHTVRNRKDAYR